MRILFILAAIAGYLYQADIATAQKLGKFEVCSATDKRCQTPGTVGILCLGPNANFRKINRWRDNGDALRVRNGRWEMYFADTAKRKDCARVLIVRASQPGRDQRSQVRFCDGGDRSCQQPGMVGLTCLLSNRAVTRPTVWQYTGDAMRVASDQWMMYYSHNNQTYVCESVVVGQITYRSNAAENRFRVCRGDDNRCQTRSTVVLSCDIEGDGFYRPQNWLYNGRSIRMRNGQWEILYPDRNTYPCQNVVVTTVATGGRAPKAPSPPSRALPSGAVILFDGYRCPKGWSRIGEVRAQRSSVFGMSYCRLE
ncbi:hypothetical protein MNBD_ALPHA09-2045 [hydrothermal vent metagenome]|uniref:Uncharacterized protein n=1 Tax=hydrothermal vent metagenome TaxID=652676 RepID=A0A3B0TZM9_9ZZZZ